MDIETLGARAAALRAEVGRAVLGQDEALELLLIALIARGHALLEGPPGTAKTLLARSIARALALEFGRIQFTPDLMPGDVLGVSIYDFQTGAFRLTRGPVFCDLLLADEINRAPPKTQAALLQVMNERVATIDGTDHPLDAAFTVIATQNPIESQGTYPLPEAQLDRFLFKIVIGYPAMEAEAAILRRHAGLALDHDRGRAAIRPVLDRAELAAARALADGIRLDERVLRYVLALVRATRSDPDIRHGVSTRAADALVGAIRAAAALDGRAYALPDDVQRLFLPAIRHRIVLGPMAEIEGRSADQVLQALLDRVAVPR